MRTSIATIDQPEFINLQPYNPLISKCEIKVFYVGENRNQSFISKQVAQEMANSLPGCPIVGYFKEEKDDFRDHGHSVVIEDGEVKFEVKTKPYGFVAPDAPVWFQKFEDTDEFGNTIEREYLMTTGYLWTGQYEEAQKIIDEGRPQSMELDENNLSGNWATNPNTGVEFFIINDAIFSKLAILGVDVEPCFEGAEITAPKVSSSFSLDEEFKNTLFSMMQDLRTAIESREGGLNMTKEELIASGKSPKHFTAEEKALFTDDELGVVITEFEATVAAAQEEAELEYAEKTKADENAEDEEFAAKEDEAEGDEPETDHAACDTDEDEDDKPKTNMELQAENESLQTRVAELEAEVTGLREFKLEVENSQKDALIESFYMLSDADKAEVIANKANYSLKEIEAELAIICFRNKVSFDIEDDKGNDSGDAPEIQFTLDSVGDVDVPAFVQVLRSVKKDD